MLNVFLSIFPGPDEEDALVHVLPSRGSWHPVDREVNSGGFVLPLLRHVPHPIQVRAKLRLHAERTGSRKCYFPLTVKKN
jgi:hypothetical protein